MEVLDEGLGDGQPVVRRRTPADLVQNHQGTRRCLAQDRGSFGHLHHERRKAGGEIVVGAHAGEDAV